MPDLLPIRNPDEPPHTLDDCLRRLSLLQAVAREILAEAMRADNLPMAVLVMVRCERQLEIESKLIEQLRAVSASTAPAPAQATALQSGESPTDRIMAKLDQMARRRTFDSAPFESPER